MAETPLRWDAARGRQDVTTEAGLAGPPLKLSKIAYYRKQLPVFLRKNRGLIGSRDFWRLLPRMRAVRRELAGGPGLPHRLIVSTHHKAMTTYFNAVLRLFALASGWRFQKIQLGTPAPDSKVLLSNHGKMDFPALRPYRGIHVMRDPRDMIVSGYHYHKWTNEAWVHRADAKGRSYQEKLNAVDKTTGLFMEIDHFIFFYRDLLESWDLDDPDTLEVSYEALMGAERDALYHEIFTHLGCTGAQHRLGVDLMRLFEAKRRTGRTGDAQQARLAHIRSGRSEQWREELQPAHLDYIEVQLGPVLRKFGYAPH